MPHRNTALRNRGFIGLPFTSRGFTTPTPSPFHPFTPVFYMYCNRISLHMAQSDRYSSKRQLKAIKSRGKSHSSTITGNAIGIFPQRELEPEEETKHKPAPRPRSRSRPTKVENMTISIDLEVKEVTASDSFLAKLSSLVGLGKVNRDFEVLATAEKVIRALAKAKFKNVATVELDGQELYHHPEEHYDIDEALERLIEEIAQQQGRGENVYMKFLSKEHECEVDARIARVHMTWMHDILVRFHGQLPEEYFRRIINYLEEHLAIEGIEERWREA